MACLQNQFIGQPVLVTNEPFAIKTYPGAVRRLLLSGEKCFALGMPARRPIPPPPPGWNKTISELTDEMRLGLRGSVGTPEIDWARDYERSLIPHWMRFPQPEEVYEVLADHPITFMTSWAAPFTGSQKGHLLKGDRVQVSKTVSDPKPISVTALAVNYGTLEARLVPLETRMAPKYGGFYFSIKTTDLNTRFRLLKISDGPLHQLGE